MPKSISSVLVVCLALGLAACVSEPAEPEPVKSSTSQNHEGLVTISWESEVGSKYRLVAYEKGRIYKDDKIYPGTGEAITIQFKRDPSKPLPEYRVMLMPQAAR